jgi:hypothetical protein
VAGAAAISGGAALPRCATGHAWPLPTSEQHLARPVIDSDEHSQPTSAPAAEHLPLFFKRPSSAPAGDCAHGQEGWQSRTASQSMDLIAAAEALQDREVGYKRPRSQQSGQLPQQSIFGDIINSDSLNSMRWQRSSEWPMQMPVPDKASGSTDAAGCSPPSAGVPDSSAYAGAPCSAMGSPMDENAVAGLLSLRAGCF